MSVASKVCILSSPLFLIRIALSFLPHPLIPLLPLPESLCMCILFCIVLYPALILSSARLLFPLLPKDLRAGELRLWTRYSIAYISIIALPLQLVVGIKAHRLGLTLCY